jgi:hypothetical protein
MKTRETREERVLCSSVGFMLFFLGDPWWTELEKVKMIESSK